MIVLDEKYWFLPPIGTYRICTMRILVSECGLEAIIVLEIGKGGLVSRTLKEYELVVSSQTILQI